MSGVPLRMDAYDDGHVEPDDEPTIGYPGDLKRQRRGDHDHDPRPTLAEEIDTLTAEVGQLWRTPGPILGRVSTERDACGLRVTFHRGPPYRREREDAAVAAVRDQPWPEWVDRAAIGRGARIAQLVADPTLSVRDLAVMVADLEDLIAERINVDLDRAHTEAGDWAQRAWRLRELVEKIQALIGTVLEASDA